MNSERILAGLDAVDWAGLEHAYGQATDVPGQLRQLASNDSAERKKALNALYGNIWHQGTVYQATPYAVPFLLELLDADLDIEKSQILVLLSCLAFGTSYHEVHQDLIFLRDQADSPEYQEAIQQELVWVKAAREAVCAGTETYQRLLLSDPSSQTKAAACYLLGVAAESPSRNRQILEHCIEAADTPELVRVAALLATGFLNQPEPVADALLEKICISPADRSARVAAALALCRKGSSIAPEAKRLLFEVAADTEDLDSVFRSLPWEEFDLRGLACMSLATLEGGTEEVLHLLIEALDKVRPGESWTLAATMLQLVFDERIGPNPMVENLSTNQKSAVAAIAESEKFWTGSSGNTIVANASNVLSAYGLPSRRPALRRFLAGKRSAGAAEPSGSPVKPWWKFW